MELRGATGTRGRKLLLVGRAAVGSLGDHGLDGGWEALSGRPSLGEACATIWRHVLGRRALDPV